jgi:tRNA-dihydrouridine synthase
VPQILGNDPDDFLLIARDLYALGYRTINLNLGCPHPQVTKKRRGSGMLPFGDVLFSFLAKVFAGLPDSCSLSVKVRLGLEDSDELARLMPLFNDFP